MAMGVVVRLEAIDALADECAASARQAVHIVVEARALCQ